FSAKSLTPAAAACRIASGGTVLVTAIRRTSSGLRPDLLAAASIPARTRRTDDTTASPSRPSPAGAVTVILSRGPHPGRRDRDREPSRPDQAADDQALAAAGTVATMREEAVLLA